MDPKDVESEAHDSEKESLSSSALMDARTGQCVGPLEQGCAFVHRLDQR